MSTLMCLKDHLFIRKTGDEKWGHAVVVGIPLGNALWVHAVSSVWCELEEAIRLATAQAVDSDAFARVPIHQRRLHSRRRCRTLRKASLKVTK